MAQRLDMRTHLSQEVRNLPTIPLNEAILLFTEGTSPAYVAGFCKDTTPMRWDLRGFGGPDWHSMSTCSNAIAEDREVEKGGDLCLLHREYARWVKAITAAELEFMHRVEEEGGFVVFFCHETHIHWLEDYIYYYDPVGRQIISKPDEYDETRVSFSSWELNCLFPLFTSNVFICVYNDEDVTKYKKEY